MVYSLRLGYDMACMRFASLSRAEQQGALLAIGVGTHLVVRGVTGSRNAAVAAQALVSVVMLTSLANGLARTQRCREERVREARRRTNAN